MSLESKIDDLIAVMTRVAENQEAAMKLAGTGGKSEEAEPSGRSSRRSREETADKGEKEETTSRRRSRDDAADKGDKEETTSRRRSRDDDKGEKEEAAPRRRRASADKEEEAKPAFKRPAEGKAKIDDIRACFAEFLNTKDKKEESARRDHIEDILDFLKADKTSDIDKRDFDDVLDWVEQFIDGKFKGFPKD